MKLFTILHTNDLHSSLLGIGPSSEYAPLAPGNDGTKGGFARLSTLIRQRREARLEQGPVLVLDAGDYSMGTAFGAATRETGGELQLMALMGYDATTFGDHDFDFGPEGLQESVGAAAKSGRVPLILASNTNFKTACASLAGLRALLSRGTIRRHAVVEREGIRFGIFGLLGNEAVMCALGAGALRFIDPLETAREMVQLLREQERADIVICLSHGGVVARSDGSAPYGEDLELAKAVPGIDIVIGGHSHTKLKQPVMVSGRTPVVQAGKDAEELGELAMVLGVAGPLVMSYKLHAIDGAIPGDRAIDAEVDRLSSITSRVVFTPRGYTMGQPLAVVPCNFPNGIADPKDRAPLANLVTDAIRMATNADIGFTVYGMIRSELARGTSGVQLVYDVFALAPFGSGVLDSVPGNALVTVYLTAGELKRLIEFFLADCASGSCEYFPLTSGMKFRFDRLRPRYDVVTQLEIGDVDRGYRLADITGADERLYGVSCNLAVGVTVAGITGATRGKLQLIPKNRKGEPLQFHAEPTAVARKGSIPCPHLPRGTIDKNSIATVMRGHAVQEIKEWQAIMNYLRDLPRHGRELPVIPMDDRATELRAAESN